MKILELHTTTYLLISILLLGAILRLNNINQPFTDYIDWRQADVAIIADNFYRGNWNILYPETSWNGPGKNYLGMEFQTISYLTALLYLILGQHDWVGRVVAVLFGLWGIFALFKLVDRVWDREHAIVSAAVMAILPGSVFVERSFIPDPVMVSLVVTCFWLLIEFLRTDRPAYLILTVLSGVLGVLTKISGLIVGIPMLYVVYSILRKRDKLNSSSMSKLVIASSLVLTPVILYYLWALHLSRTYPPYYIAGSGNWLWNSGFEEWFKQKFFLPVLYWDFDHWIWTKPVIILVMLGLILLPPHRGIEKESMPISKYSSVRTPWLFHWWIFAGVLYYIIGAQELVINSWNFHVINPAASVLAARGIISLANIVKHLLRANFFHATVVVVLLAILISGQVNLRNMYNPVWKSNAIESYKLGLALNQNSSPENLVITMTGSGSPSAIYYSKRRGWIFPPSRKDINWSSGMVEDDSKAIRLLDELLKKGVDFVGLTNNCKRKLKEISPKFFTHIEKTFELKKESEEWVIYQVKNRDYLRVPAADQSRK